MIFDDLYARYDGNIPQDEKAAARAGSYQRYYDDFLRQAERGFTKRCLDLVQSLIAWRLIDRYAADVKETMLCRLSRALLQTRNGGRNVYDVRSRF